MRLFPIIGWIITRPNQYRWCDEFVKQLQQPYHGSKSFLPIKKPGEIFSINLNLIISPLLRIRGGIYIKILKTRGRKKIHQN